MQRRHVLKPTRVAIAAAIASAIPGAASAEIPEISDRAIRNHVESEIASARGVSLNDVDVNVDDGVVTLGGVVDHVLARERALRNARLTVGVRSVVDRVQVAASARSDSQVREDVLLALASDPATESWEVGVDVDDGSVTLNGTVDSHAERELASSLAQAVRGVRGVVNHLEIETPVRRAASEIENDVHQRLRWDVRLDDGLVDVDVDDGVVTLTGKVGSAAERRLAMRLAWVKGVRDVVADGLEVSWTERELMQRTEAWQLVGDNAIERALRAAFAHDPRVDARAPEITVENGVVTLSGQVDNLKARHSAAQDARNTVGVLRVKNHLRVKPQSSRTAEDIEADARMALERDPFLSRRDITVRAYDSRLYLEGQVESNFERAHAGDLAARIRGVSDVRNALDVDYEAPRIRYTWYHDWDPIRYDFDYDYETVAVKPDFDVREDIESELFWSPFVDSDRIDVSVDDGEVTLTGDVQSLDERRIATEQAIEGGAIRVINRLDIADAAESIL